MNFKGFIGPAYQLESVNVDCQRCVNLYPEMIQSGNGKDGSIAYLKGTPGLKKIIELDASFDFPIRGVFTLADGDLIFIAGQYFIKASYNSSTDTYTSTPLSFGGSGETYFSTTNLPIRADSFILYTETTTEYVTVLVDGAEAFLYEHIHNLTPDTHSYFFGKFQDYGLPPPLNATHVDTIDGYLIYAVPSENRFYVSNHKSLSVSALSFASSEGDDDRINGLIANGRDLWIFNERSIEIFTDTGNADFPFERIQGGYIEKGCLAPYSIAKIERNVFWLGRDEFGHGQIYMANGLVPQRISTNSIEQAISSYVNPEKATAYTYQKEGHSFYCINFEESTWVYDLSTGLWHERQSDNESGELKKHRASSCVYWPAIGKHVVGDYAHGKIYILDENTYSDDTLPITRYRTSPHITNDLKRITCHSFTLDMETGVGLDGNVQGSDPQVVMTYSKDFGHSWSSEAWESAGKKIGGIGDFRKRVIWRRLGQFRDLAIKVKITDPVKVRLINASFELEQAVS